MINIYKSTNFLGEIHHFRWVFQHQKGEAHAKPIVPSSSTCKASPWTVPTSNAETRKISRALATAVVI
jgi:hypothetical protein